jgi:DNA-binding transcriptional MocR family regulator
VERIIAAKAKEAAARNALALKKLAPYALRSRPEGFFVWLSLPTEWTGREMELASRMAGVRVFSAERFAVGGRAAEAAIRISLTGPETREELSRGLDLVAGVLSRARPSSAAIL